MAAQMTPGRGSGPGSGRRTIRTSTLLLLFAVGLVGVGAVTALTIGSPQAAPPNRPTSVVVSTSPATTPAPHVPRSHKTHSPYSPASAAPTSWPVGGSGATASQPPSTFSAPSGCQLALTGPSCDSEPR